MKKSPKTTVEFIKIIISILIISGGIVSIGMNCLSVGLKKIKMAKDSVNWAVIDGIIIQSESIVKRTGKSTSGNIDRSDDSYLYTPMIKYQYTINDSMMVGDKINWSKGTNKQIVEGMVQRFPLNKKVKVHYDPDNPEISVLEPGHADGLFFLPCLGIIFILIGAAIGVLIWKFGIYIIKPLLKISVVLVLLTLAIFLLKFFVRT